MLGPVILVVGIITFAWSTILGWSYYGERCAQYLWGKRALLPYKLVFVAIVVVGPVLALDLVWTIADILNALMAIPNLIAVLLLSGVIARETRHYLRNLDEVDKTEIPAWTSKRMGSAPAGLLRQARRSACRKSLAEFAPAGAKKIEISFPRGHAPRGKHFSGRKCGICPPEPDKSCARRPASYSNKRLCRLFEHLRRACCGRPAVFSRRGKIIPPARKISPA